MVNNQLSPATINANKQAFVNEFVTRTEFRSIYDGLSNTQYVDRLFQTTGVTPSASERQALIDGLGNGSETRASVLFKVVDGTRRSPMDIWYSTPLTAKSSTTTCSTRRSCRWNTSVICCAIRTSWVRSGGQVEQVWQLVRRADGAGVHQVTGIPRALRTALSSVNQKDTKDKWFFNLRLGALICGKDVNLLRDFSGVAFGLPGPRSYFYAGSLREIVSRFSQLKLARIQGDRQIVRSSFPDRASLQVSQPSFTHLRKALWLVEKTRRCARMSATSCLRPHMRHRVARQRRIPTNIRNYTRQRVIPDSQLASGSFAHRRIAQINRKMGI